MFEILATVLRFFGGVLEIFDVFHSVKKANAPSEMEKPWSDASPEASYFVEDVVLIHEDRTLRCDAFSSRFGGAPLGRPDEGWPTYNELDPKTAQRDRCFGRKGTTKTLNLFFIGQINIKELPFVPEHLKDLALISIFVDPDFADSERCVIRAHENLDGLVPLQVPDALVLHKPCAMAFEKSTDMPIDEDVYPVEMSLEEVEANQEAHVWASKIGGYASPIQDYPFDFGPSHPAKPQFCLQLFEIKSLGVGWVDAGAFFLGRGTAPGHTHEWFCDIQFL